MAVYDRSVLPSRPVPWVSQSQSRNKPGDALVSSSDGASSDGASSPRVLDAARMIGLKRVGAVAVAPDGKRAVVHVSEYDFETKKSVQQLWSADLELAATLSDEALRNHEHLRRIADSRQQDWASLSSPKFSPDGKRLAFLSNRPTKENKDKKTSVWTLPMDGPGEASLLAEFPMGVGDLEWTEHGGLAVAASVYVDREAMDELDKPCKDGLTKNLLRITADRDEALKDDDKTGGLNAVLYKRLPIREWDRWLDAKFAHPFYVPIDESGKADAAEAIDLLEGIPTAVPSGAFGGSEVRNAIRPAAAVFFTHSLLLPILVIVIVFFFFSFRTGPSLPRATWPFRLGLPWPKTRPTLPTAIFI